MENIRELKKLLEENITISKEIHKDTEKIKRYLFWARIWKLIRFAIIAAALIAGFIYSKPYLEKLYSLYNSAYQTFFNSAEESITGKSKQTDSSLIENMQELIKSSVLQSRTSAEDGQTLNR